MSHHLLADIWNHLEKRTDIDNILRELIGQHALESSVSGGQLGDAQTFQFVVSLKLLFDLQRVYLQSLTGASSVYFLQIPQLFLAVSYLLQIKPGIVSRRGSREELPTAERTFLLQTILAGFRVLSLRNHVEIANGATQPILSIENLGKLRGSCKSWDDGERTEMDTFIIDGLCESTLDDIGGITPHVNPRKPRSELELPDYNHALYPIEPRFGDVLSNIHRAIAVLHEKGSNWNGHYMVMYDVFWSTAAASIKLYADQEKERKISIELNNLQKRADDLQALRLFRESLFESLYRAQKSQDAEWYSNATDSVVDGLLPLCFQKECGCFKEVFVLQDDQTTLESFASLESVKRALILAPSLESALRRFLSFLIVREQSLTDCNGDFKKISDRLSEDLRSWSSTQSSSDTQSIAYSLDESAYILPCRKAHPISTQQLRVLIEDSAEKQGLEALEHNEAEFDVDISCKICVPEYSVSSVRQVVPLSRMSSRLQELIGPRSRHSVSHSGSHSESKDSIPDIQSLQSVPSMQSIKTESGVRPPSVRSSSLPTRSPSIITQPRPPSVGRTQSAATDLHLNVPSPSLDVNRNRSPPPMSPPIGFLSITEELPTSLQWPFNNDQLTTTVQKRTSRRMPGFVKGLWDKSPHRPSSPAFTKPSYAFFADGKSILLWTSRRIGYSSVDSTSIIGCEMGGIEHAAGGSQKIGVVSVDGGIRFLRVYKNLEGGHEREFPLGSAIDSIALSPDDQFVAVTYGRTLMIYDLDRTGISYKHTLPDVSKNCMFDTQKLSFTSNGKFVIASTRDKHTLNELVGNQSGTLNTYVGNTTQPTKNRDFRNECPMGKSPDLGITSALYNDTTNMISLTFFTEDTPPHIVCLSPPKTRTIEKPNLGKRIQCAAMSPAGDELVMLNSRNEVFWVHNPADARRVERCTALSRPPVSKKADCGAVGMADAGFVRFFWIEERKGVLTRIDREGVKETMIFGTLL